MRQDDTLKPHFLDEIFYYYYFFNLVKSADQVLVDTHGTQQGKACPSPVSHTFTSEGESVIGQYSAGFLLDSCDLQRFYSHCFFAPPAINRDLLLTVRRGQLCFLRSAELLRVFKSQVALKFTSGR